MVSKYKHLAVSDNTHAIVKGLARVWGLSIDDAVTAAMLQADKVKGGNAHKIMADRLKEIRANMNAKAERDASVRRVAARAAAKKRQGAGPRFDHSVWKWADLAVDGTLFIPDGLQHGARSSAQRYRFTHSGWDFRVSKTPGGWNFKRIA